jgi:hypothetical protein
MSNWTEEELQEAMKRNADLKIAENVNRLSQSLPLIRLDAKPFMKRNKYNVSAREDRTYNGVVYASKKEMKYYIDTLEPQLKTKEIDYVLRQVPFDLGANITYRADFVTLTKYTKEYHWNFVVYEVKGMETPEWKLKHKLFKDKYPLITLKII